MAKIILADDHAVLRDALSCLLSAIDGLDVVAQAGHGLEVVPLVEKHLPDLLIIDLSMPNLGGLETINRLQKLKHTPNVLVLSARDDENAVTEVMRAGAKGFVPKSASTSELTFAIESILKGQTYLSPSVCEGIINGGTKDGGLTLSQLSVLTAREREVMKLLSEGHPNREVAKILHISPRTIDSHRANIMKKLGVTSNASMVQVAIRNKLVE